MVFLLMCVCVCVCVCAGGCVCVCVCVCVCLRNTRPFFVQYNGKLKALGNIAYCN